MLILLPSKWSNHVVLLCFTRVRERARDNARVEDLQRLLSGVIVTACLDVYSIWQRSMLVVGMRSEVDLRP